MPAGISAVSVIPVSRMMSKTRVRARDVLPLSISETYAWLIPNWSATCCCENPRDNRACCSRRPSADFGVPRANPG